MDLLGQHPARYLGNRAQRIAVAGDLLDDDHHAGRRENRMRGRRRRAWAWRRPTPDSVPVVPFAKPIVACPSPFDSTTALRQSG